MHSPTSTSQRASGVGSGGAGAAQGGRGRLPPVAEDGSRVKIHNADLFVECMQSADWGPLRRPGEKHVLTISASDAKLRGRGSPARGASSGSGGPSGGGAAEKGGKARRAFADKQALRDHEFKMKLEVAKKEADRRRQEMAQRREREFEQHFSDFQQTNRQLAEEVDAAITADEQWRQRKKERLYNEWMIKVFQPMQDEINLQLSSMTVEEMEARRRSMFQAFLDESNKKTNGLFRDIVIESDYDPFQQASAATVRYRGVSLAEDPTKNRATREQHDDRTRGLLEHTASNRSNNHHHLLTSSGGGGTGAAASSLGKRTAVGVEQWAHMEATPYGRYSSEDQDPTKRRYKPNFMRSAIKIDHYDVPCGAEGSQLLRAENSVKGKKIVKPPFELQREGPPKAGAGRPDGSSSCGEGGGSSSNNNNNNNNLLPSL